MKKNQSSFGFQPSTMETDRNKLERIIYQESLNIRTETPKESRLDIAKATKELLIKLQSYSWEKSEENRTSLQASFENHPDFHVWNEIWRFKEEQPSDFDELLSLEWCIFKRTQIEIASGSKLSQVQE
jgi:hypothetical protein